MRYNLYILPSPSKDFEGDIFDSPGKETSTNIHAPSQFLVTILKTALQDLAEDGLCNTPSWRMCYKVAEELAFLIFA